MAQKHTFDTSIATHILLFFPSASQSTTWIAFRKDDAPPAACVIYLPRVSAFGIGIRWRRQYGFIILRCVLFSLSLLWWKMSLALCVLSIFQFFLSKCARWWVGRSLIYGSWIIVTWKSAFLGSRADGGVAIVVPRANLALQATDLWIIPSHDDLLIIDMKQLITLMHIQDFQKLTVPSTAV